tara:strand:- start:45 stop:1196 length:1152 start_codon:yes stop_codon:yes gene_type:complete
MKKIAIIGAGISGLFIANLFKENKNYKITIFEKKKLIELGEGYGIQLSTNSIKLLNEIGFNKVSKNDKFNPEKIDFYKIKEQKKICDLNISEFNFENCKYTTLKRSTLVEFLKNRLDDEVIKYEHSIEKIEVKNQQISLRFNKNQNLIYDHLIISDGVFSKGKSLVSSNMNEPIYNNCIAIRGNISKNCIDNINQKNISLYMGSNFHYVIYPVDPITNTFNFIGILKYNLTLNEQKNYSLFNDQGFIKNIKNNLNKKISSNMLDNLNNIKCFPIFVSKDFYKPSKNIYLIGDAFFAFPPSFAQGASQSIEGASELFDSITNERDDFYNRRLTRAKMINNRSKINQFAFHLSNPLAVFFRNVCLKILTKNNKFLDNYLGKIYKN